MTMIGSGKCLAAVMVALIMAAIACAQTKPIPKTLYFDYQGNQVSNNEFVDIRMANPNYPDATRVTTLPDGTTEFHLQKIPQEGMVAPTFSVTTIDGKKISSEDLKGKVVVLSFWFIGCPSCRAMEPKLNSFKAKFADRDDVVFLAMTADPTANVKRYLSKERFDYLQAADAKAAMDGFVFGVYPKNVVISRSGEIVYWRSVIYALDKFESVVRTELERKSK